MKIDFYTQIHKALRRWLFRLSIEIANSDYANIAICRQNHEDLLQLIFLLKTHAKHEEEFFHPLIDKKIPGTKLTDEHEHQEVALMEIEKLSQSILHLSDPNERVITGLILYQKFNQFIADYLSHLDSEEKLMPVLQQVCTEQELLQTLQSLLISFSQQEIFDSITYMLPALNPQERLNMMQALLSNADTKISHKLFQLAKESLNSNDWLYLETQLECDPV